MPFPPQLLQYFFPPLPAPFNAIVDFDIAEGEDGLELFGVDVVDFFDPWEDVRGDAFFDALPPFLIDPAGDGVPLVVLFSAVVATLLLVAFVFYLLVS